MDRLTGMQAFVKAAELGSLTAAAAAMGTSPQMVGKHVASLEERLGAQLLRRTTRRQSLTDVGQAFYERCRVILAETEAAEALTRDLGATPRGRLRIGAPVNYGACRVAPLVTRFLRDFPEVQVELSLSDRYVDIVDEGYDAVFRLGPLNDSTLVSRMLGTHRQVACASPAYLAARGVPVHPEDLAAHDCLGYVNWSGRPVLGPFEISATQIFAVCDNDRTAFLSKANAPVSDKVQHCLIVGQAIGHRRLRDACALPVTGVCTNATLLF